MSKENATKINIAHIFFILYINQVERMCNEFETSIFIYCISNINQ